jgi:hypothetical protein
MRRRPGSNGTAPNNESHASDSDAKRTGSPDGLTDSHAALGSRIEFGCPVCRGGNADATYKLGRDGQPRWFVGCKSIKCPDGAAYLDALGDALGVGAGRTPEALAGVVRARYGRRRSRQRASPLPTREEIATAAHRLLEEPQPLRYLTDVRGLTLDVIAAHRIGWGTDWYGRDCLTFPIFDATGSLVSVKVREPRSGDQMRAWPGCELRALYPQPERAWWTLVLVAGELDALRARAAGLPACSVTRGAGQWHDDWTAALRGRRVVVAFDNGEEDQARATVARLLAAGVRARRLDLRDLGLTDEKGDLSDYLNRGGSIAKLRRAMRPRIVRRAA